MNVQDTEACVESLLVRDEPIADPQRRRQAREYARIRRRLLLADLIATAALLGLLLVSGASGGLRDLLARVVSGHLAVVAGYVACLVLGSAVLFSPLAYYRGFVLPHRYRLSVQSAAGWAADYVKSTLLGTLYATVVALAVYTLLRHAPEWWWVWAAIVVTLVAVVLAHLAPVVIVPLFYTLRPLEDAEMRARLLALARRAGAPVCGVYVLDLSRRTLSANAAVMGIGNTRRIVLGDTLWERFTPDEIEAVLAHELGHHVHGDLWRGIAFEAGITVVALFVVDRTMRLLLTPLGFAGLDDPATLPLLLLVGGGLVTLLLPLTNGFSRRMEAAADRFAVRVLGNSVPWMTALRKLADQNLAEVDPPAWVEWALYSHPSIRHRLEAAALQT